MQYTSKRHEEISLAHLDVTSSQLRRAKCENFQQGPARTYWHVGHLEGCSKPALGDVKASGTCEDLEIYNTVLFTRRYGI